MNLLAIADFDLVVVHGGFGQASRRAARPKATLSRRVIELEKSLGVRLIERGSRPLRLTEAGAQFHLRTSELLAALAEAEAMARAASGPPSGLLRISAPVMLSDMVLGRIAVAFTQIYPAVRLDITAEDRIADLATDRYDVVIRVNPSANEPLVGRRVLRDERWLVAAPSVPRPASQGGGVPPSLPAVVRSVPRRDAVWQVRKGTRVLCFRPEPMLRLTSLPMLRDAVVAAAGAALLPRSLVGQDVAEGRLACWGVEVGPPNELWALYPSRRFVSPAVSAFIDHLAAALSGSGQPTSLRE